LPARRAAKPCVGECYGNAPSHPAASDEDKAAQEQQQAQKAACVQLNDALRAAPSNGVDFSTLSGLLGDYQTRCREIERAASREVQTKGQKQNASVQQAAQARLEALREQCGELNRILSDRRKRWDGMNAGERADLQRFETSYNGRCKAG